MSRRSVHVVALLLLMTLVQNAWGQGWSKENGLILLGDIVTMRGDSEESSEIIKDGKLAILGEKILAVCESEEDFPEAFDESKAITVQTNGWIFPGLIDAHNHPAYNFLPLWEVPQRYNNRYEWAATKKYEQEISSPMRLIGEKKYYNLYTEAIKYAKVKAIVGGVTSIQGSKADTKATRILARTIEGTNFGRDRIYQYVFEVTDSRFKKKVEETYLPRMASKDLDALLIHLAEGIDSTSRAELGTLKALGMLCEEIVAIHCTALEREDFREMNEHAVDLVWSPTSNLLLYGRTADIPSALDEGVRVSLGADWSPSGCKNLLGELKMADQIDKLRFNNRISDHELVQMVTVNPAEALELVDNIGTIEEDNYADIAVFEKVHPDPYRSLINSNELHVKLVLVGGEPLYGDREVMEILKPNDYEILEVEGIEKAIDVTNPEIDKGDQTLAAIIDTLEKALKFDREHMRNCFAESMTEEEFEQVLDKELPDSLVIELDPIFAFGDERFFSMLNNSEIANFGFDVSQFWRVDDVWAPVLSFINSSAATCKILDIDVGLDKRAAGNIVKHRDGSDGEFGTSDDSLFDTIEELDNVAYVGPSALERLRRYVNELAGEDYQVLNYLNRPSTTYQVLDDVVKLNRRAAEHIIAHRNGPDGNLGTMDDDLFNSLQELDAVKYVGPSTLRKIKEYVANL